MLEMFDKLDDIVYEPIKLVCAALRQPLKNMEAKRDAQIARENKEHEARLAREAEEFALEMELRKKQSQAELESQIANDQLTRNVRIAEEVKKYQIEMANAASELTNSIGQMQFSLREKAHTMCLNKTKEYEALQREATKQMMADMKEIRENFPEDCPERAIMLDVVKEQRQIILDSAKDFIVMLKNDMGQLLQHFNTLAEKSVDMSMQMLAPMRTQEISGRLQNPIRETKLLK
ncbi:MAG: hypothetical protein Q4F00_06215 [bacterium]|nr:hypothetical protein [bacterium]